MVKPKRGTRSQAAIHDESRDGKSGRVPNVPPVVQEERNEIVYRRADSHRRLQARSSEGLRERARAIAPAITPLVIGFTLLLALILLLGYFSVRRMDSVGSEVLNLEQGQAVRLGFLLKLRLALTKLNNEARTRLETESRRGLKPPFDLPLATARDELKDLLKQLERPPLTEDPSWKTFDRDLKSYLEVTQDLRRYSLEGFTKFRVVDGELNDLLAATSGPAQDEVTRRSETIEQEARRFIRWWSIFALLVGGSVAAGTIWVVQRHFNQMRQSMFEARRERVFTNQLLEGMVSAVAAIDENDRIRSANAAFFKIFPAASIGATVREKFAPEDAMKILEAATASRVDKATYRGRWVCRILESGAEETLDVYSSPLAINGDLGQIVTLVDATEAAEAERGLRRTESLAAVGQATTQVAHEIRNPLGSIRLGVSMLRDSINDKDALTTIELVERGIKHLNKLVVDVTQFSRQNPLELSDVDLNDLMDSSLDLVSDLIKERNIVVVRRFSDTPIVGEWDADQLRQVFVNIIANAIDASPKGGTISISTDQAAANGRGEGEALGYRRFARIRIVDEGEGIDEATRQRIFEPFFTTKKRGTGLGLAIVKQIVEQHKGKIEVESNVSTGTTFVIDLPL
jgi:signal transduction histidine kinase